MVDKYRDPLLTPRETARHLQVPRSTFDSWLREEAAGEPLVHRVPPLRRGWSSVPFVAIIEAYVLRSLRDLRISKRKIREASAAVRREFGSPYGLATRRVATDGIDIFIDYADGALSGHMTRSVRSARLSTGTCGTSPGMRGMTRLFGWHCRSTRRWPLW